MARPQPAIVHTEGESNNSAARGAWNAKHADAETKKLLDRDAAAFLHQSLSSPCVTAIADRLRRPVHAKDMPESLVPAE